MSDLQLTALFGASLGFIGYAICSFIWEQTGAKISGSKMANRIGKVCLVAGLIWAFIGLLTLLPV